MEDINPYSRDITSFERFFEEQLQKLGGKFYYRVNPRLERGVVGHYGLQNAEDFFPVSLLRHFL